MIKITGTLLQVTEQAYPNSADNVITAAPHPAIIPTDRADFAGVSRKTLQGSKFQLEVAKIDGASYEITCPGKMVTRYLVCDEHADDSTVDIDELAQVPPGASAPVETVTLYDAIVRVDSAIAGLNSRVAAAVTAQVPPTVRTELPEALTEQLADPASATSITVGAAVSSAVGPAITAGLAPGGVINAAITNNAVWVNVKARGITPGSTPTAAQVAAVVDEVAAAGGGVIYFPRGTYTMPAIKLRPGVEIRGDGPAATVFTKAVSASTWITAATGSNLSRARIRDITIDAAGNVTSRVLEASTDTAGFEVIRCAFTSSTGSPAPIHVEITGGASDVTVESCTFSGCTTAIRLNGASTGTTLRANAIRDWADCGVYVLGTATTSVTDLAIERNIIYRHRVTTAASVRQPIKFVGVDAKLHERVRVTGNRIYAPDTNFLDTLDPGSADCISLQRVRSFEVSGNFVWGSGDVGITISQQCEDGLVFGNRTERTDTTGINIGSGSSTVGGTKRIQVYGNLVVDPAMDRPDTGGTSITRAVERAKSGINFIRSADCAGYGNRITYRLTTTTPRYAFNFTQAARIHVYGNGWTGTTADYFRLDGGTDTNVALTTFTPAALP